jgi:hypothetical protein
MNRFFSFTSQKFFFLGKVKLFFLFCLFLFNCSATKAQSPELTYAHKVIDTLTSSVMNGRGYVDSSDFKAAVFIQHELQRMKLNSFTADYYQPFSFDANTFPGKMEVALNGKKLIPGKDFLVDAASGGAKGKFKMKEIPHQSSDTSMDAVANIVQWLIDEAGKKVFVTTDKDAFTKKQWAALEEQIRKYNGFGVKGYIIQSSAKLTWDASQEAMNFCWLQVNDS